MKEHHTTAKRTKAISSRKLKATPKLNDSVMPRRTGRQPTRSWQLLIDRERMLI